MADKDGLKIAKDYHVGEAFATKGSFYVKGANNMDWGMKKHLSNIFNPKSGNTVMLAFDHGYFMGCLLYTSSTRVARSSPARHSR